MIHLGAVFLEVIVIDKQEHTNIKIIKFINLIFRLKHDDNNHKHNIFNFKTIIFVIYIYIILY